MEKDSYLDQVDPDVDSHAQIPKKSQAKQPAINQAKRKPEGFILPA